MKNVLYMLIILNSSCAQLSLPIEYDTENPTESQISYNQNTADEAKHYIVFRHDFDSEWVKVYEKDELIDEGVLKPYHPSLATEHIAIIDRKNRKVKIVFDNETYHLNLEKEYQYIFMDKFDGKIKVLFSKYIQWDY